MRLLSFLIAAVLLTAPSALADPQTQTPAAQEESLAHFLPPDAHKAFSSRDGDTRIAGFVTDMTRKDADAFLETELAKDGWRVGDRMRQGKSIVYLLESSASKSGGLLTLTDGNGTTQVLLMLRD